MSKKNIVVLSILIAFILFIVIFHDRPVSVFKRTLIKLEETQSVVLCEKAGDDIETEDDVCFSYNNQVTGTNKNFVYSKTLSDEEKDELIKMLKKCTEDKRFYTAQGYDIQYIMYFVDSDGNVINYLYPEVRMLGEYRLDNFDETITDKII